MAFLTELWLPIVVSAFFVFIVSSITHMVLPYHKSEFKKMPNEDEVMKAMRDHGMVPGHYMFPCGESMKDWDSPEMKEKRDKGPMGLLTVVAHGLHHFILVGQRAGIQGLRRSGENV